MSAFDPFLPLTVALPHPKLAAMTTKTNIIALAISAATFAGCCLVMLQFGPQMNSKAFVYPFMAVWGLSALVWPLFAIRTARAVLSRR
jgi:hypothetical protein